MKPTTHKDIKTKTEKWFYTDIVKDHFFNPRNICKTEKELKKFKKKVNGTGIVGSPACGDVMELWLVIENEKIKKCKWRTFGCASAIASTSMLSVMITENNGMSLENARKLKPQDIIKRLGTLPNRKFHCSVLGDKALRLAINDYYKRAGQLNKIVIEGAKIIDKILKITDKDIEEAVLEGAKTFEDLQKKTKIGIQDKNCIPETKKLIKFYQEKYFG